VQIINVFVKNRLQSEGCIESKFRSFRLLVSHSKSTKVRVVFCYFITAQNSWLKKEDMLNKEGRFGAKRKEVTKN
jgi:hypothetical protein